MNEVNDDFAQARASSPGYCVNTFPRDEQVVRPQYKVIVKRGVMRPLEYIHDDWFGARHRANVLCELHRCKSTEDLATGTITVHAAEYYSL
jgi:hypothetical protein